MKNNYRRKFLFAFICISILNACNPTDDAALIESYSKNGACSIDSPQQSSTLPGDKDFAVGGWAYDKLSNSIPETLTLYFINENSRKIVSVSAQRGTKREDVAKAFSNEKLINSGFDAVVRKDLLEPGIYKILIVQSNKDAGAILCEGDEHKINVR